MFLFEIPLRQKVNIHGYVDMTKRDIQVFANTKEDMMLFLKQHNFNIEYVSIQYIPDDEVDDSLNEMCGLQDFHFKSNKTPEMFTIKTTQLFVNHALTNVGNHLSDCCMFGEAIFRDDFEFIKLIVDLLNKIPFVEIADYSLLDGNSIGPLDDMSWMTVKKDLLFSDNYEPDMSHIDTSEIYDALHQASDVDEFQPITIEAYVRSFSEEMLSASLEV